MTGFLIFVLCAIGWALFLGGLYSVFKKPDADRSDNEQE
mgnify:CR=1 FL=1